MSEKPTNQVSNAQTFERIIGQRICVEIAQGCINQIEQTPAAIGVNLNRKAALNRIIDACRDVYQEIENEAAERSNDACS